MGRDREERTFGQRRKYTEKQAWHRRHLGRNSLREWTPSRNPPLTNSTHSGGCCPSEAGLIRRFKFLITLSPPPEISSLTDVIYLFVMVLTVVSECRDNFLLLKLQRQPPPLLHPSVYVLIVQTVVFMLMQIPVLPHRDLLVAPRVIYLTLRCHYIFESVHMISPSQEQHTFLCYPTIILLHI